MTVELPGGTLGLLLMGITVGLIGTILLLKRIYRERTEKALRGDYKQQAGQVDSQIAYRAKYRALDVFGLSSTLLNFGLAVAVGLSLLAFGWTQYEEEFVIPEGALELDVEILQTPPRMTDPPPPPPPPPPPVIEKVPEHELLEEEPPPFENMDIDPETVMQEVKREIAKEDPGPPPPPPPPPPLPKETEPPFFVVAERMPMFPGCDDDMPYAERKVCSDKKMLEFIYQNIKFPAIARENRIDGTAVVSFIVEKDGTVAELKVLRDPGARLGEEALRVVNLMNVQGKIWTPGRQAGENVRVQFNLPVKFRLQ